MQKRRLEDLAIFGGTPAFAEPLHVGRPHLGDREAFLRRVNDVWDRRWLTNGGPYEHEFEQRLQKVLDVRHCIVTANATVALEILIRALDLQGEVLLPTFTFVATAHAVQWLGLTPVFCDIDSRTHNLDADDVERRITSRSSAILGVHLWGRPAPIERLADVARRHDLRLIFDAAQAFGCTHRGRTIGGFGDAEVFSFHATKVLNTFEGGAIATNDNDLAERVRRMRIFGFTGYDRVESAGTNGKLSEIGAAMGLTSLESLDQFVADNCAHYETYKRLLEPVSGVSLEIYEKGERNNYQYVVTQVDELVTGVTRDDLQSVLLAEQVLARRYFFPGCHRMAPYVDGPAGNVTLPHSDHLASRVLCLPSGAGLDDETIAAIVDLIVFTIEHGAAVRARLHGDT
jgi:dTDP-4-amino-4,6-dideoxygalactose transaminase